MRRTRTNLVILALAISAATALSFSAPARAVTDEQDKQTKAVGQESQSVEADLTTSENAGESLGRWEELPLPPAKDQQVHSMGMEPGGIVWIMANGGLYYWDGEKFTPPLTGKFTSGPSINGIYGGPDRGLYATQRGEKEHQGRLFKLCDGDTRYVADFYYETSNRPPGLYVSKSGKIYNWGNRFLAVYSGDKWKRIEARLDLENTLVFETGQTLYFYSNGKLYCADADDNLTEHDIPATIESRDGPPRVYGALWGSDRIMILKTGERGVYAYDLKTCQPVPTDNINAAFGERVVWDVFRAADGSVWVMTQDPRFPTYLYYRILPDGELAPVDETTEFTSAYSWDPMQASRLPHSLLTASDGSVWFGLQRGGIARLKDGKARVFGWSDGLSIGRPDWLFEDPHGNVYAASGQAIYVLRPSEPGGPTPPDLALWEEYETVSHEPVGDGKGNIWMFLRDRPGEVSRWDGYQWQHIKVPFDTSKVSRVLGDDRGHILVQMGDYPEGCFDIGPDSMAHYENLQAMLVAAVAEGAKRFYTGNEFQGCYVLEGGKIWFGYNNYPEFECFDGDRWDHFSMDDDVNYMYESPKYGIIIRTQGEKYYGYDRGQIVEIEAPRAPKTRWILGPKGLQPFEEELLTSHPELYTPVELMPGDEYYLLLRPMEEQESREPTYVIGDQLPHYMKTVTPGYFGGYWTGYAGLNGAYRIFGGKVFKCDFSDSPLVGKENDIRWVADDRAHNLWIDAGWYGNCRHVFLKRLDGFKLKVADIPAQVKRELCIEAEPVLPGLATKDLRLFWRFEDGLWQGGEQGGSVAVRFPTDGEYHIEVMGMDPQGGTSEISHLAVHATVFLPKTEVTEGGPYVVKDVVWTPPVEMTSSLPGALLKLAHCMDGGDWQIFEDGRRIALGGLEPGEHSIEIAAQDEEGYRDLTPLSLK